MKKPTAGVFFAVEGIIWIAIIAAIVATGEPHITVKIALANMGVACFNIFGAIVSAATGWAPWRD